METQSSMPSMKPPDGPRGSPPLGSSFSCLPVPLENCRPEGSPYLTRNGRRTDWYVHGDKTEAARACPQSVDVALPARNARRHDPVELGLREHAEFGDEDDP